MNDKSNSRNKIPKDKPGEFRMVEEGIDLKTQIEYIQKQEFSEDSEYFEIPENVIIQMGKSLLDPNMDIDLRKKVLIMLAHTGNVVAYRQIENYYNHPGNDIKTWTTLAMQECRMFLEMSMNDESVCIVSSGLGGSDNKLRLYFFVLPSSGSLFTEAQQKIIEDEFRILAKELDCVIEKTDRLNKVVGFTVLISYELAPDTLIRGGIEKCNELGNFVLEHYYAGNIGIPDDAEIDRLIKIVLEGEPDDCDL